jgi:hypothetical protein
VEVAHEALIRTWPRLRQWISVSREKLRARAAVLQAKADWEQNNRRDDMLLPIGLPLERARSLLADPGDITTDDIKEFISLSSAREDAERKQREEALARDEARVAEIKAGQERTARLQWITRWAFAAVGAVIISAGLSIWWLQWDKARQLTRQENALAESRQQLDEARVTVSAEQLSNANLKNELDRRQLELKHSQANLLAELSETKRLTGEFDAALRLASHGTRIDLALPSDTIKASAAAAALAAAVSSASWRIAFGGNGIVFSAAFSPDGSHIITASGDKTARIWDAATGKEIAVLRGHDHNVIYAGFSSDGSRVVTASIDTTARNLGPGDRQGGSCLARPW